MRHALLHILAASMLLLPVQTGAQKAKDMAPMCDSLQVRLKERTSVTGKVSISKMLKRGSHTDIYFTKDLGGFPWHREDVAWLRSQIVSEFMQKGYSQSLGEIFAGRLNITDLITPTLSSDGWQATSPVEIKQNEGRLIEEIGATRYTKGLDGRHIALWQSHGRYYSEGDDRWMWQRAPVNRTVEDLYTQQYVLPFLIPMLENAGAYVMTPRERDTNSTETVIDNDGSASRERSRGGQYSEKGSWKNLESGFADAREAYDGTDNPFTMGTARVTPCTSSVNPTASARWSLSSVRPRRAAVYVSWKSLPESSSCARYTVSHRAGKTSFIVNQKMGGGMWIYLGTFDLGDGSYVELDNSTPSGRTAEKGAVVSADAVRIGGGMGKIIRGGRTSGLPSYAEGAMYSMQWSGIDSEIWKGWDTDYVCDYASRGAWTKSLKKDKGIPIDMSFAFHSDAGTTPSDSTVGTLAIYTLRCDGSRKNSDGTDRMSSRTLCDFIQSQVTDDIRRSCDSTWSRREMWDKSYSECRTSDVPGMILELLSHQNFADMKRGLDPAFQFTVSRAVYKGMLKFLSMMYSRPYVVQPLPVKDFSIRFAEDGKALLEWEPRTDSLERTATPKGYIVYTRTDDGAFDKGTRVTGTSALLPIRPGHIQSYKVAAWNEGGTSFPSEILSIYTPEAECKGKVLIVNGFQSVRAPYSIESDKFAGFDGREDNGVPYIEDLSYAGEVYDFDRSHPWISNPESGCGATYTTYAPGKVAGNTFDFAYLHGQALSRAGWAFCSASSSALGRMLDEDTRVLDYICGKEKGGFGTEILACMDSLSRRGTSILISGSEIGAAERLDKSESIRKILGYRWVTDHGCPDGKVGKIELYCTPNPERYCVEHPCGIRPSLKSAGSVHLRYNYNETPAAVFFDAGSYKVATYGFPLETIKGFEKFADEIDLAMKFLTE